MTKAKTLAVAATSSAGARLVSNSRWNLIAFSISLVINFATIPIVISYIGLEAFGAAGLVIAIYAPFMLVGTVLILPAILGYTAWVYWVFRGKVDTESGYHH